MTTELIKKRLAEIENTLARYRDGRLVLNDYEYLDLVEEWEALSTAFPHAEELRGWMHKYAMGDAWSER